MNIIDKIEAVSKAVSGLQKLVASEEITKGERLPEDRELSHRLNVGLSTIREALFILQALGSVEIKRGKGTFLTNTGKDVTKSATVWFSKHAEQMSDYMVARQV